MIKFEQCTVKDLDLLNALYIKLAIDEGRLQFPKVSLKDMNKDLNKYEKDRKSGFLKELKDKKNNFWYFAKVDDEIIGFVQAQLNEKDKTQARLEKVYVIKKSRRKYIAKKLCEFVLKILKKNKVKEVWAGIYSKNIPSIKLHESLGFEHYTVKMKKKL